MSQVVLKTAVLAVHAPDTESLDTIFSCVQCHVFTTYQSFEKSIEVFDAIIVFHSHNNPAPVSSLVTQYHPLRLVVLSENSDENSIVDCLNSGAHHFINLTDPKRVFIARLTAALRSHPLIEHQVLKVHPYTFILSNRTVLLGESKIELTPREFELAHYLFANQDRIISDSELLTGVWTLPSSMDTRRIDTAICRIRSKLGLQLESSSWSLIRLRRRGYRLVYAVLAQRESVRSLEAV